MSESTQALTLTAFIEARLADDEAAARGAFRDSVDDAGACHADWSPTTTAVMWGDVPMVTGLEPDYLAAHIARHDPARVLAQVEALRAIVALHSAADGACETCYIYAPGVADNPDYCPTLRHLAAIWRDHDDWREEWSA